MNTRGLVALAYTGQHRAIILILTFKVTFKALFLQKSDSTLFFTRL